MCCLSQRGISKRNPLLGLLVLLVVGCGSNREFAHVPQLSHRHFRPGGQVEFSRAEVNGPREQLAWIKPKSSTLKHLDPFPQPIRSIASEHVVEPRNEPSASLVAGSATDPGSIVPDRSSVPLEKSEPQRLQETPERTEWNWLAVASPIILIIALVAAIPAQSTELLLIGCLAALAAAIIGARQCREKGQKGQGFAMAVMGLAAAGVVIGILALLTRL